MKTPQLRHAHDENEGLRLLTACNYRPSFDLVRLERLTSGQVRTPSFSARLYKWRGGVPLSMGTIHIEFLSVDHFRCAAPSDILVRDQPAEEDDEEEDEGDDRDDNEDEEADDGYSE